MPFADTFYPFLKRGSEEDIEYAVHVAEDIVRTSSDNYGRALFGYLSDCRALDLEKPLVAYVVFVRGRIDACKYSCKGEYPAFLVTLLEQFRAESAVLGRLQDKFPVIDGDAQLAPEF